MFSILNHALSWAITSFGNKLSEKEFKVDKGFKQQVLRQIHATRDRSILSFRWSLVPKFFAGLLLNASIISFLICVGVQNLHVCF